MLGILAKLEEATLRDNEDSSLITDMVVMNTILQQLSDDCICNMQENQMERSIALNKLYDDLALILYFAKLTLVADVSLRMVQLTLSKGITPTTPIGFIHYGQTLASMGNISKGCRLGELVLLRCILFHVEVIFYLHFVLSYITYSIYYDCARELGTQAGRERSMY